jgi:hypothetical protein
MTMKKKYFFIAALLLCFGLNAFSQAGNRQAVIGLERYRNLDLKKMALQKINLVTDDLQILTPVYSENFDLGVPANWTFSGNSNDCLWAVDATANPPGYFSAPYSLNYNNGVDFNCGRTYGAATTPLLNVGQALIQVSFQYIKDTETPEVTYEVFDMLYVSVLDQFNNILYTETPVESTSWSSYTLFYQVPEGVNSIKVEFYFDSRDNLYNDYKGVFIDDLEISRGPMVPLSNWAVFIGIFLVATVIIIRYRRTGS